MAFWLVAAGVAHAADSLQTGLVSHWKLAADTKDDAGKNHGAAKNIIFANGAAVFNGRDAFIEVPDAKSLDLSKRDFSISVWVKAEVPMRNVFGDILSKFDGTKLRGLNFHIAGTSSGYRSMNDTRHVHFGMDDGYLGTWENCGKPEISNSLITDLVVFEGQLYAGIADAKNPKDACRVYRYGGGTNWIDCGRVGDDPNHLSVQSLYVHQGKLYAGTGIWSKRRAWGAQASDPKKPAAAKPRVFVYEGGTKWGDLGQVGESTRVLTMASFNGELYVGLDKLTRGDKKIPGRCYKMTDTGWQDCGVPDGENFENLLPVAGVLYGATHGSMFRYEGGTKWTCIGKLPHGITQIHTLDIYRGQLLAGTWPQGYALGYEDGEKWSILGRLGLPEGKPEVNEINDLLVHNGKMYAGVIPQAEVYRYEGDGKWTLLQSLGTQPNLARDNVDSWCRVTALASYQGKLFAGTGSCYGLTEDCDPDGTLGRVYTIQAGQIVSHEHDIGGEWTHVTAVRRGKELQLFVNGKLSATSPAPDGKVFDVSNNEPLKIGFGAQNYFTGSMSDLRIYDRALATKEINQLYATRPVRE